MAVVEHTQHRPHTETSSSAPQAIIAVHGIGEQIQFEAVQSVVYEISRLYGFPKSIPIGRFHAREQRRAPARRRSCTSFAVTPFDPLQVVIKDAAPGLFFAEAYWANVPRELVEKKYVLEETKKWARTIAAHVATKSPGDSPRTNFSLLETVLEEMIETVFVLERLTWLLDRLGLLRFNLRKLLESFLGDVQVVTEFTEDRGRILDVVSSVMRTVVERVELKARAAPDVYIVAHSEGTVVALLGLLKGITKRESWVERVRGLMTIGSPLEVHLLLWDELWRPYERKPVSDRRPSIEWRNYYDRGDPIAYSLENVEAWVKANYSDWISFSRCKHEFAFSRYFFPGKAHVDYWRDAGVFGHFVKTVMGGIAGAGHAPLRKYSRAPRGYGAAWLVSYVAPYVLVLALIATSVYAIYRPVTDILFPEEAATERGVDIVATGTARVMELSGRQVVKDVAELTALLGGVTACAVVLRITSTLPAGMVGLAALVLGLLPAYLWPTSGVRFIDDSLREVWFLGPHPLLALAAGVASVAGLISRFVPRLRLHLLGAFGIGATALVVLRILRPTDGSSLPDLSGSELWPVIVGAGLFMYLWWLASMIFELSFVWHRHVRHEGVTSAIKGA